jgi:hypothetical protein
MSEASLALAQGQADGEERKKKKRMGDKNIYGIDIR